MAQRESWQYCQVEVISNDQGILRQFFADRAPVEMQLYQNWPSMIAKLGLQGWELISALPGVTGKSSIIYIFSRKEHPQPSIQQVVQQNSTAASPAVQTPAPLPPQPVEEDPDDGVTFEPLRGI